MGLPDSTGRASYVSGADLRRGVAALKTFKKSIDKVLSDFEGSAGGATKVGSQQVSRASFSSASSPFGEADGLFTQYARVHQRLTSLSKALGQQIEAMGIAVHGADVGFDNLDEEVRRRFWAIQTKIDAQYERDRAGDGRRNQDNQTDAGW
ncbi:hypothetical protein [Streptomyces sp. NPDC059816]|uniref:hypothetical protein n=1 Tax=Streptomyces sp. NPDC059816 TaxID=3346960 RepID=UPI00365576F0